VRGGYHSILIVSSHIKKHETRTPNLEALSASPDRIKLGLNNSPTMLDRRKFLIAGLGLAAAPLLPRMAASTGFHRPR
jgi:hypothetical protein